MRPKARGDLHCGTFGALVVVVALAIAFAVVLACSKEAESQSFTFYGNGWSVSLGPSSCGGWRPYCPPPPIFYGPPPCGGRGWNYAPPPRYGQRPPRGSYYSQPMRGGWQDYGYGGSGSIYDDTYARRLRQLEEERQRQIESDIRRAARRNAEADFQFYNGPRYGGW